MYGSDKAERVEAAQRGRTDAGPHDLSGARTRRPSRCFTGGSTAPRRERCGCTSMAVTTRSWWAGPGGGAPLLRVIGGGGDDRVVDSSSAGRTRFYDARGNNEVGGLRRVPLDTRPLRRFPADRFDPVPRAGLGRLLALPALGHARVRRSGFFFGGGLVRYDFGFRKRPYRSRLELAGRLRHRRRRPFRAEFLGDFHRVNSRISTPRAAPRLRHRGGPLLRLRQRDAADRLRLLLPGARSSSTSWRRR